MIKLYIDNQLVELDGNTTVLLSRTRTDYLNPTLVKNSFSKTITIPNTEYNTKIFNSIWKLDRYQTNEFFNPSKRTPFTLYNSSNDIIESGYVKLNKINRRPGFCNYEITLYGELGNILYGLTYKEDPDTKELTKLTLGDLIYSNEGKRLDFKMHRGIIDALWHNLESGEPYTEYWDWDEETPDYDFLCQHINFMVAYNGVPKLDSFDPKKCIFQVPANRFQGISILYDGIPYGSVPRSVTVDNKQYSLLHLDEWDAGYGLIEYEDAKTDLEMRDLRSYLLRPVIKLSSIFEGINNYINKNGWSLVYNAEIFSKNEYYSAWVTLNMLYEVMPDIQSYKHITQEVLLSKTAEPSSYLISFCKIYGIYLDVDVRNKTITLTDRSKFFSDEIENLNIDTNLFNITPLSFDKNNYTFDFAEGESEFLSKYNETYLLPYGSKRVNTGYEFGAESEPYISNNVFKIAVDALEQSSYFRNTDIIPLQLIGKESTPAKFSLFRFDAATNAYVANTADIKCLMATSNVIGIYENWTGNNYTVYNDAFPKLQFHKEDNEASDGSNVLVYFNGMQEVKTLSPISGYNFTHYRIADTEYATNPKYCITDDIFIQSLPGVIDKNCWYYDIEPADFVSPRHCYQWDSLPMFTRYPYEVMMPIVSNPAKTSPRFPAFKGYGGATTWDPNTYVVVRGVRGASSTQFGYTDITLLPNHQYLILASSVTDYLAGNARPYATIMGDSVTEVANSKLEYKAGNIDSAGMPNINTQWYLNGCIANVGSNASVMFTTGILNNTSATRICTRWYQIIDLTRYGLQDKYKTVSEAIEKMRLMYSGFGTPYMSVCSDFSVPREIYVPGTMIDQETSIYSKYWKQYISDLYSINTRVIEGTVYLDDINKSFRKLYWFDDALWCLSSVTDWDPETKKCKAKLIKVNDKNNYLN